MDTPLLQPRIDVHAHYLPAGYRCAAEAAGHEHPDGAARRRVLQDNALTLFPRLRGQARQGRASPTV